MASSLADVTTREAYQIGVRVAQTPQQPCQVLHVVRSLEVGGLERMVVDLVSNRGFANSKIACLCTPGAFAENLLNSGATVTMYQGRDTRRGRLSWLNRQIRHLRPDIIHCHGLYALTYGGLVSACTNRGCLVLTKHGQEIPNTPLVRWLIPWLLRRTHVICVSAAIRELMRARFSATQGDLRYIRNGIDLSRYHSRLDKATARARLGFSQDSVMLGSVGRLSEDKGFDVLVDAIAQLDFGSQPFLLVIAGDGPCRPKLEKEIERLGLTDCVVMLGERHDIADLLACCDGFVLASRTEGQPLSIIEAMSSGLPVIATTAGGIPELIEDGVTGVLVAPDDVLALRSAISDFLHCREQFGLLGCRAQRVAQREFGIERMLLDYEDVYQTALGSGLK